MHLEKVSEASLRLWDPQWKLFSTQWTFPLVNLSGSAWPTRVVPRVHQLWRPHLKHLRSLFVIQQNKKRERERLGNRWLGAPRSKPLLTKNNTNISKTFCGLMSERILEVCSRLVERKHWTLLLHVRVWFCDVVHGSYGHPAWRLRKTNLRGSQRWWR